MTDVTNELMYEVLKNIQSDMGLMKADVHEIKHEIHAVRGHIVAIQTDISNLYKGQADLKTRLDRVDRRMNLAEELQ